MELFSKNILSYPIGFYLLKVNNENSRTLCKICSKLTTKTPERYVINYVLVSLLLHLNILHKLFWCFICWLWTKNVGYADFWQGPKYANAKFEALPSLAKKSFFVRAEEWVKWIDPVTKYMFIVNNKDTWTKYLSTRDISRVAYIGWGAEWGTSFRVPAVWEFKSIMSAFSKPIKNYLS